MVKIDIVYEGDLHCRLTHGPSGNVIQTDAPVDNNGKGEAFSPTDLLAASLGSCMMTVMGIAAKRQGIELKGTTIHVEKEMITAPVRRIGKITIVFTMCKGIPSDSVGNYINFLTAENSYQQRRDSERSEEFSCKREILERAAHACPVHKSLHPDVETPVTFTYPD